MPLELFRASFILSVLLLPLVAAAGTPRHTATYPAVVQRGEVAEVEFRGSNLADTRAILWDEDCFEVELTKVEAARVTARIRPKPDATLGEHVLRLVTGSGIADARLFYVTPYPVVAEQEPAEKGADPKTNAQKIALGTTVYGRTKEDDQDWFSVDLKKGDRLSVETLGSQLQTQNLYDPAVSVVGPDGQVVLELDDHAFGRQNPVLSIVATADGPYLIQVRESTYSGVGECHYVLNVGSFPRPLAVYPAGGPRGTTFAARLIGDAAGPREVQVALPTTPQADWFRYYAHDGQSGLLPLLLRISDFPNVMETEPNNERGGASPGGASLPFALNGVIEAPKDIDFFKVPAKKGEAIDLTVYARDFRSPLDSVLTVYDQKGNQVASNDDSGRVDSYLRVTPNQDGEYTVAVKDQLGRGGPGFVYRVEVTAVTPSVTGYLPEMVINNNQERRAIPVPIGNRYATLVRVKRNDTGGHVRLDFGDLPPGVKVHAPLVAPNADTVPVIFEADETAKLTQQRISMRPVVIENGKELSVPGSIDHRVDIAENGNQKPYYTIREDRFALAVTEALPVEIALQKPTVPLIQNGSLRLKSTLRRTGDFKGPVSVELLYGPNGVGNAGPMPVPEGKNDVLYTVSANAGAAVGKWKICLVGTANVGNGTLFFSTGHEEIEIVPPFVSGQIVRTFVEQGGETTVEVRIKPLQPFDGEAKVSLLGLPPEVTASPDAATINAKTESVKFAVKAGPKAPVGQHRTLFCQFALESSPEEASVASFAGNGVLRVDKGSVAAK